MVALLHGKRSTRAEVFAVPTPQPTQTYFPVPYAEFVTRIEKKVEDLLPWEIKTNQFSLSADGSKLFGVMTLRSNGTEIDSIMPSIGYGTSHDGTHSGKLAAGGSVMCCANGMFSTDGLKVMRKHTKNFYRDFDHLMEVAMWDFRERFNNLKEVRGDMKEIHIPKTRGYEILGAAYGEQVLTSTQFSEAVRQWDSPSYGEAFTDSSAWSLYNAITSGLKKGHFSLALRRFTQAHDWFLKNQGLYNPDWRNGTVVDVEVLS